MNQKIKLTPYDKHQWEEFERDIRRAKSAPKTNRKTQLLQHLYALFLILVVGSGAILTNNRNSNGSMSTLDVGVSLFRRALSLCPPSITGRDILLTGLIDMLQARYRDVGKGSVNDLQEHIKLLRESLGIHPTISGRWSTLAAALSDRYARLGDLSDLNECILLNQKALDLCTDRISDQAGTLFNLATALDTRYARLDDLSDLEGCIRLNRQALASLPVGHRDRFPFLSNFASALGKRYIRLGEVADLEECIGIHQRGLDEHPVGHPNRFISLSNLAAALISRYERLCNHSDLEKCIRLNQEALAQAGNPDPSISLNNLAAALTLRYASLSELSDLEECINSNQQALVLCPVGHPGRFSSLSNLAIAMGQRYQRLGELPDLEECIRLNQEALYLRQMGHTGRSAPLLALANALGDRYTRLGEFSDLEKSILLYQEALASFPVGHPDRFSLLNDLALAMGQRYQRLGELPDLEECICLNQEALTLCTMDHPHRSKTIDNLCAALGTRFTRLGEISNLEECIRLTQQALASQPVGHPARYTSLSILASALGHRYALFGQLSDLEESICLNYESLTLCAEGNTGRAGILHNLSAMLKTRYECHGELSVLEECIRLCHQALVLRPVGHQDRSSSLGNLAAAVSERYARFSELSDLELQIRLIREALASHPVRHPSPLSLRNHLAVALKDRYARLGEVADLEECIRLLYEVLDLGSKGMLNHASVRNNLATALSERYAALGKHEDMDRAIDILRSGKEDISSPQVHVLHGAFLWVALSIRFWPSTIEEAIISAVAYLRQYLSTGPTTQLQYSALLREPRIGIATLPTMAAAYFIAIGRLEQSVELLDESRALLTSELRRFRDPLPLEEVKIIGEELSSRYLGLCEELRNLSNAEVRFETFSASSLSKPHGSHISGSSSVAYGELIKAKRVKMEEFNRLLAKIRCLPGCEDFQKPLKFAKLKDAARDGPVIIVNCFPARSDVIIVFSHRSPLHLELSDDFYQLMKQAYEYYLTSLSDVKGKEDVAGAISEILEEVAMQLWNNVVSLVVKALQDNSTPEGSRIWWCPTSFLTSLPFHAAGNGSEWLIDYYVSSYTPTLGALIGARQIASDAASTSSPPRILVIAQTRTSGLKNAGPELHQMQTLSSFQECLDEEDATPESVANHLTSYDWVHFICHGSVADNPFDSYLHLYNESKLTLNGITKLHLTNARFAFLAACHSAGQSWDESTLRDEVLHLSVGMQVSGFRSVVGTMWQMEDEDGPRMARKFYEEMFQADCPEEERHTLAARALWKAVRWLKNESLKEERREKRKKKAQAQEEDDEGTKPRKKGKEREEKEPRKPKKRANELPLARWANYIHIGA